MAYPDFQHPRKLAVYQCSIETTKNDDGDSELCFRVQRLATDGSPQDGKENDTDASTKDSDSNTSIGGGGGGATSSKSTATMQDNEGCWVGKTPTEVWTRIHNAIRPQLWTSTKFKFPPGDWMFGLSDVNVVRFLEGLEGVASAESPYKFLAMDETGDPNVLKRQGNTIRHAIRTRLTRLSAKSYATVLAMCQRLRLAKKPSAAVMKEYLEAVQTEHDRRANGENGGDTPASTEESKPIKRKKPESNSLMRLVSSTAARGHPGYYPGLELGDGKSPEEIAAAARRAARRRAVRLRSKLKSKVPVRATKMECSVDTALLSRQGDPCLNLLSSNAWLRIAVMWPNRVWLE